ncbi:U3 small nucleolar ribonucleoprotein IMP4 [Drechslerella stenobrocha 248]|uniref:U3 small nucleolar ribonucleoprotein protein IMP4 n=1 Tax=Drechslerella stenobrocha 248 TaxID=1043628 RepID=W7HY34_9PEZI|nr:U3 small nucleolar ribonucleoprotein IMP4 [Drechslerella stenobrocha 248]
MIRRTARERREYLYRKQLVVQDAAVADRRAKLRASLASGKSLSRDIADDEQLRKDYKFDEPRLEHGADDEYSVDDEYAALSGVAEPKLLITTSRNPSSRLMQFAKEVRLLFPTSIRLNRGNTVLPQLASSCLATSISDLLLLHEHRGVPTALTVSHFPHGPTAMFSLHNVVLRHDIDNSARGTVSEAYPHLIFEGFSTPLGKRVVMILKHLFPPGVKKDSARVVTFALTEGDYISVRHHVYVKTGPKSVELAEVGPRMEMKLFEIRLGTAENRDADAEWRLNQYTRTAKKKDLL